MTCYAALLTLTVEHAFYGPTAIPIRLIPADPAGFDRSGLLLRRQGNEFLVAGDLDGSLPKTLVLDVAATTPDVFSVTQGADWNRIAHFQLAPDTDILRFDPGAADDFTPQMRSRLLARLTVTLGDTPTRQVTLQFDAVESLWAYHVIGPGSTDALEVVDPDARISFSPRGALHLPDGRPAQVIRSDKPLAARARPTRSFSLQRAGAFGPQILIPVLPAAGKVFKPVPEGEGAAARLQSDIYVTLW